MTTVLLGATNLPSNLILDCVVTLQVGPKHAQDHHKTFLCVSEGGREGGRRRECECIVRGREER